MSFVQATEMAAAADAGCRMLCYLQLRPTGMKPVLWPPLVLTQLPSTMAAMFTRGHTMRAHQPCTALMTQLTSGSDGIGLREGEDFKRDSVEADELRLAELGRKTVEMYAIAHIFNEGIHVGGSGQAGGRHGLWVHALLRSAQQAGAARCYTCCVWL
jgi:hypothetical protein